MRTSPETLALIKRLNANEAGRAAEQRALDEVRACGRRVALRTIKARARAFMHDQWLMERLFRGLAGASPRRIIAIGEHLLEQEEINPTLDTLYAVKAVNAKAVILAGRALRMFEFRERRAAA